MRWATISNILIFSYFFNLNVCQNTFGIAKFENLFVFIWFHRCISKYHCTYRTCTRLSTRSSLWHCTGRCDARLCNYVAAAVCIGANSFWHSLLPVSGAIQIIGKWYTKLCFINVNIVDSAISLGAIIVFSGCGLPGAAASAPSPRKPRPGASRASTGATHDDGNYFLYVSVDTVIRGLILHNPAPALVS